MSFFTQWMIAVGLSMDAFAVAASNGMMLERSSAKEGCCIALSFGVAQGIMPVIGWLLGSLLGRGLLAFTHWASFLMLSFIGCKMIYEAFLSKKEERFSCQRFKAGILFTQAVATSLDAMAVGISFALLKVNILSASCLIAATTCLLSSIGVWLGQKMGHLLQGKAEIIGGCILLLTGVKILIEG